MPDADNLRPDYRTGARRLLGWARARLQHEHSLFQRGDSCVGVGVGGFQAVHAGEVPAGKCFQAAQDFRLHVAHGFYGLVFGGLDGRAGALFRCSDGGLDGLGGAMLRGCDGGLNGIGGASLRSSDGGLDDIGGASL
jgi:hypothetical protein